MKRYVKAIVNLSLAVVLLLLVILLVPRLLVFFSPFVAAWIVAVIACPIVRFFEEKLKIKRKAGTVFVIIVVIALLITILYAVGTMLGREIMSLLGALPDLWAQAESDFDEIADKSSVLINILPKDMQLKLSDIRVELTAFITNMIGKASTPTLNAVSNFAKSIPNIIIGIIMGLLASYFFVAERLLINEWFKENTPTTIQTRYQLVKKSLVRAVGGYLKAQLKIEIWMYLLLVIGMTILRIKYAVLIAIGVAFLDLLPFFGTGTVLVPWAIIKFLSADYKIAIGLLILWGVGQLTRQVIQPKIVGDSIGVPPIPTLFLLYIGFKLSGVIGMILAVPIGLILYTMYEEGLFDTTKNSIMILVDGINRFRKLNEEDLPK